MSKIMNGGKVLTSEHLNAEFIVNEQQRIANENNRNVHEDYNNSTQYYIGNKVVYNGSTYLCKLACKGVSPTSTNSNLYWKCIAAAGGSLTNAVQLPITDGGNYYSIKDVNSALQQAGSTLASHTTAIADHTTQLAQIANEKAPLTYVDQKVAAVASGSPKNTFTTLAALQADSTANTTDGKKSIYVVSADGNWYYWNTTSLVWTSGGVYQGIGIGDGVVTKSKLYDDVKKEIAEGIATSNYSWKFNNVPDTAVTIAYPLLIPVSFGSSGNIKKLNFYNADTVNVSGTLTVYVVKIPTVNNYAGCTIKSTNTFTVAQGNNSVDCDVSVEQGEYVAILTTNCKLQYSSTVNGYQPYTLRSIDTSPYILTSGTYYNINFDYVVNCDTTLKKDLDNKIIVSNNPWLGKKCCTVGNSLVQMNQWQPALKKALGFNEMWIRGIGGTTLSNVYATRAIVKSARSTCTEDNTSWYYSDYTGVETIPSGYEVIDSYICASARLNYIPSNMDLILLMVETNDFFKNAPIGTLAWRPHYETRTWAEDNLVNALAKVVYFINTTHPQAKIVVLGMPWNSQIENLTTDYVTRFFGYQDAMKDTCRKLGVEFISLVDALQWNNFNVMTHTYDGVHFRDEYYIKCASTDTGALLVVASEATTGQINLADVTPRRSSYTPVAGDYVLLYNSGDGTEVGNIIAEKLKKIKPITSKIDVSRLCK